jgi:hypothetical protein
MPSLFRRCCELIGVATSVSAAGHAEVQVRAESAGDAGDAGAMIYSRLIDIRSHVTGVPEWWLVTYRDGVEIHRCRAGA